MFKQTATDLTKLPKEQVKQWIDSFDTVLTDCDGVVWVLNEAIKGSPEVINRFSEIGKKVFFITNNSTKSRSEFLKKALTLGFNMTEDGIVSTAYAAAKYLQSRNFTKKVFVIGMVGITHELDLVGIRHTGLGPDVLTGVLADLVADFKPDPEVGAVIVGFDEHFSFPKLFKAASYLNNPDVLFIGTNTDERFPMPKCVVPGTGSIVRSVEVCSERKAHVMGKPDPLIVESLIKEHSLVPERTLMIGDRCNTDIQLGTTCGFQTLLVGTGIHNLDDVKKWQKGPEEEKIWIPDVYAPRLGDLLTFLNN